jgi:hypothetical protein
MTFLTVFNRNWRKLLTKAILEMQVKMMQDAKKTFNATDEYLWKIKEPINVLTTITAVIEPRIKCTSLDCYQGRNKKNIKLCKKEIIAIYFRIVR